LCFWELGRTSVPADFEAHIARDTNETIKDVTERLANGRDDDSAVYEWFCECGCMAILRLTVAEFQANGAWLDGHKPV
jgi:hypothetical protein